MMPWLKWLLEILAGLCFLCTACDITPPRVEKSNLTALGLLLWMIATEVRG